jgi:hypothetical protein
MAANHGMGITATCAGADCGAASVSACPDGVVNCPVMAGVDAGTAAGEGIMPGMAGAMAICCMGIANGCEYPVAGVVGMGAGI